MKDEKLIEMMEKGSEIRGISSAKRIASQMLSVIRQNIGTVAEVCPECCGQGWIERQVEIENTITRDMALDACDLSLEGQPYHCGNESIQEECGSCKGHGIIAKQER